MSTRTPRAHDPESPTSLDLYLREIGEYPLLTQTQERALGRRTQDGDPAAAEALVSCNLRFVVMIAKRYQHLGLPLADLVNEGNFGMLRETGGHVVHADGAFAITDDRRARGGVRAGPPSAPSTTRPVS